MFSRLGWLARLSLVLLGASLALFLLHYLVFRDAYYIFYYPLLDIAFMPVNVLLVTVILNGMMTSREKRVMRKKLNMVIGAFFSEVGIDLLRCFVALDANAAALRGTLIVQGNWSEAEYTQGRESIAGHSYDVKATSAALAELKVFLTSRRDFLLRLLENPNLLEHEEFTELLWAVFHLTEELCCRTGMMDLPDSDRAHLNGDIKRAYALVLREWLGYISHLRTDYPYLFSLAVRTNPFDPHALVEVR